MDVPKNHELFELHKNSNFNSRELPSLLPRFDRVGGDRSSGGATKRDSAFKVRELDDGKTLTKRHEVGIEGLTNNEKFEYKWTQWNHQSAPAHGEKFWKVDTAFKDAVEEKTPGIYECGISLHFPLPFGSSPIVVYCGESKNLYARLVHHYSSKDGAKFRLKDLLKPFFLQGFHVYFRWVPLKTEEDAETEEKSLLTYYDYAFNLEHNVRRRSPVEVSWKYRDRVVSILDYLELLRTVLEKEKKKTEIDSIAEGISKIQLSNEQKASFDSFLQQFSLLPSATQRDALEEILRKDQGNKK